VPEGENIVTVEMRSDWRIGSVLFVADKGTVSERFDGSGGHKSTDCRRAPGLRP
jgi:hypothetical protein